MVTKTLARLGRPRVTFCGAAQEVTGSMHLIEAGPYRLLLDCGLRMGMSAHVQERQVL